MSQTPMDDAQDKPEETPPESVVIEESVTVMIEDEDDVWVEDNSGPSLLARLGLELIGSFVFILVALGSAIFADGRIVVALGFGLALWAVIAIIGSSTGGHVNPAVTVGVWVAGRFPGRDVAPYILAQVVGATLAGLVLWFLIGTNPQVADARSIMDAVAIGYGEHSPTQFPLAAGAIVEVIGTAVFVGVILAATSVKAIPALAAPTIGLTLAVLHMFVIPFTNAALNPARATGAALWANTWALEQLWVWWLAPLLGGVIAGLLFRAFGPEEDLETVEVLEEIED